MLAAAVGFVLVIGIIVLQVLLDNKINTAKMLPSNICSDPAV